MQKGKSDGGPCRFSSWNDRHDGGSRIESKMPHGCVICALLSSLSACLTSYFSGEISIISSRLVASFPTADLQPLFPIILLTSAGSCLNWDY